MSKLRYLKVIRRHEKKFDFKKKVKSKLELIIYI